MAQEIRKVKTASKLFKFIGSGYSTGSGLLVLDVFQPVRLFHQAYRRFSAKFS